MTDQDLDRLEALLAKATKAPWEWTSFNRTLVVPGYDGRGRNRLRDIPVIELDDDICTCEPSCVCRSRIAVQSTDAELIAALRNAAPAMIDRARRLREIEKLRERIRFASIALDVWSAMNPPHGSLSQEQKLISDLLADVLKALPESDAEPVRRG